MVKPCRLQDFIHTGPGKIAIIIKTVAKNSNQVLKKKQEILTRAWQ